MPKYFWLTCNKPHFNITTEHQQPHPKFKSEMQIRKKNNPVRTWHETFGKLKNVNDKLCNAARGRLLFDHISLEWIQLGASCRQQVVRAACVPDHNLQSSRYKLLWRCSGPVTGQHFIRALWGFSNRALHSARCGRQWPDLWTQYVAACDGCFSAVLLDPCGGNVMLERCFWSILQDFSWGFYTFMGGIDI